VFATFATFALDTALQYLQAGRWRSYLPGERGYLTLSLRPNGSISGTSSRSSRQTPRPVPVPKGRTWSARHSRGYADLSASGDEDTAPA